MTLTVMMTDMMTKMLTRMTKMFTTMTKMMTKMLLMMTKKMTKMLMRMMVSSHLRRHHLGKIKGLNCEDESHKIWEMERGAENEGEMEWRF